MLRIACYAAYVLAFVVGAVVMIGGDSLGLPFVEVPFWRLFGVAIAGLAVWRILIAVFGVTTEARRSRTPASSGDVMLMKGPRIQSDRQSGSTSRILIGR